MAAIARVTVGHDAPVNQPVTATHRQKKGEFPLSSLNFDDYTTARRI